MNKIRLSIFGLSGTGTSTFCKLFSLKYNIPYYYVGGIMRDLANKNNMTIEEFDKFIKTTDKTESLDVKVDLEMKSISETKDQFIIEGRLAYYFVQNAIKIKFVCDDEIRYKRLMQRDLNNDYDDVKKITDDRENFLLEKYKNLYPEIQYYPSDDIFNLIVDTSNLSPDEILEKVSLFLKL